MSNVDLYREENCLDVREMNERHKQVLDWKDKDKKTFREIGELMGITRGRASQIYQYAKNKQESVK